VDEPALPTLIAVVAVSAEPTDGDAIANCKSLDALADLGDLSGDFMPGSQRPRQAGECPGDEVGVSTADTAGADADPYFTTLRRSGLDVDEFQGRVRGFYVDRSV
jgi:hypothetical protein